MVHQRQMFFKQTAGGENERENILFLFSHRINNFIYLI